MVTYVLVDESEPLSIDTYTPSYPYVSMHTFLEYKLMS